MQKESIKINSASAKGTELPCNIVHTLVIGSGAAGLSAAVQLHANGVEDVLIVSEGLQMGTSINTGSDKQTYYKLSMCSRDADAPGIMAETYFDGGAMHGDLALVEASLSAMRSSIWSTSACRFRATPTASSSATRPTTTRTSGPRPRAPRPAAS